MGEVMTVIFHDSAESKISDEQLEALRAHPVAIIGDELNRAQMMQAAIKPVGPGMGFAGRALTVNCMVGDNLALHHATALAVPGSVLVADARAHEDTAVWGGILHTAAKKRGVIAVVVNGPVQCGGVTVHPGDVLVGDDDGVVVIRPDQVEGLAERCAARVANEEKILAGIAEGKTTVELLGL
jgi:4-hydroxy-4-methyl-2-oxoglutarate aldolase